MNIRNFKLSIIALSISFGMLMGCNNSRTNNETNSVNQMNTLNLTSEWDKTFPKSDKVNHSKITFHNRYGITLAADLYVPVNASGKLPAIAVSGPFGAVKEQSSGLYAQQLAERGFFTIAFDPSYTGESGGEPRYVASPDINTEDFSAAVDYLINREDVDSAKIGILGICGWGGIAIQAAINDPRIKATVASTMYDMTRVNANGYFNSEKNVEVMNYFHQIVENKYMSEAPIENLFESGRAAFKFDGAWEVNTIYENYPDVNLGVAPYVVGDDWDGERYTPTGSWAFAASSETDNIEGATELVKWMSGVESGVRIWNEAKSLPSTYKAFEQIDIFQTDENYNALYQQLSKYGHPRPKTPVYPQVSTSFQQALESVGLGGKDAQAELDKSVERINAKLERYTRE